MHKKLLLLLTLLIGNPSLQAMQRRSLEMALAEYKQLLEERVTAEALDKNPEETLDSIALDRSGLSEEDRKIFESEAFHILLQHFSTLPHYFHLVSSRAFKSEEDKKICESLNNSYILKSSNP